MDIATMVSHLAVLSQARCEAKNLIAGTSELSDKNSLVLGLERTFREELKEMASNDVIRISMLISSIAKDSKSNMLVVQELERRLVDLQNALK